MWTSNDFEYVALKLRERGRGLAYIAVQCSGGLKNRSVRSFLEVFLADNLFLSSEKALKTEHFSFLKNFKKNFFHLILALLRSKIEIFPDKL